MQKKLFEFISQIPKSDLHVHLDGSVRADTIIDLSKKQNASLPSFTVDGLNELVFKEQYESLVDYLKAFAYVLPIMQTPENLERISYEFAQDNIAEGVSYVEVRFAPHLHVNDVMDIEQVIMSVNRGLEYAQKEHNHTPQVKSAELPEFHYGIIACSMRSFGKGMSKFFDQFLELHKYSGEQAIFSSAAHELAKACVSIRDKYAAPLVALDIAGAEAGTPPKHYRDAYHFAQQNFMHVIAHAGEAYGAESIFQALTELNAERIGHGFHLFDAGKISDSKIQDKNSYINRLIENIAKKRTTIEVCLTSNRQTIPELGGDIKHHPFAKMIAAGLSTRICTDNRTVSKTNVTQELMQAAQNFDMDKENFKNILITGFKKGFFPGTYSEKRNYIQKIIARYELLEEKYRDAFLTH